MPTKNSPRMRRVGEQIYRIVAKMLLEDYRDPRMGFVTVSRAEMSKDLAHARIYLSFLKPKVSISDALLYLTEITPSLRKDLSKHIRLRITPNIRFIHDETIEKAGRMSRLVDSLPLLPDDSTE